MPLTLETLRVADFERSKAARGVGRKTVITQDPVPVVGPSLVLHPSKVQRAQIDGVRQNLEPLLP